MAHVIPSIRTPILPEPANPLARRVPVRSQQAAPAPSPDFRTLLNETATPPAAEPQQKPTAPPSAPVATTATPTVAAPPPPDPSPAAPTAESVFGPNPWIANPTGIAPNGQPYSYNPHYFASAETAMKVAQMAGGTVVQTNVFTPGGGGFAQQQPNYMVQLPDGRMINPGLVAAYYTHGYSQAWVNELVANELRAT